VTLAALLLLADGRTPAGGYAHSGGVEAAVAAGLVRDLPTLAQFLAGRARTAGLTAAGLAAAARAAANQADRLPAVDAEADARTPSPAARAASRAQGRALLRLARSAWPHPAYPMLGEQPHHPVVLGVATAAAGGSARDAALLATTMAVTGPAGAAVRLLGLDPLAVTGVLARLAPTLDAVADRAIAEELPDAAAPMLDVLAEAHAASPVPLFAS
jgi:urease accessory protein